MTRFLLFPLAALLLCSCSAREDAAVPRRRAYPRPAFEADSVGRQVRLGRLPMRVNRAAAFIPDSSRSDWATIVYPAPAGATMYLSLAQPESLPEAVANRRQRISLNLGGASATAEEFHVGPWACTLVYSEEAGLTTPVQILASSADGQLLSGAVVLSNPGTNADSIRPLLRILADDSRTLLKSLDNALVVDL